MHRLAFIALVTAVLILDDVGRCLNGRSVHGHQHIAALKAGGRGRRSGRDFNGGQALEPVPPQHAVLDLVPSRAHRHVRDAKRDEDHDYRHGEERSSPGEPAGFDTLSVIVEPLATSEFPDGLSPMTVSFG